MDINVVSVLITAKDDRKSFLRALTSVVNQDYQKYDVIVEDSSNNDEIKNLVNGFGNEKIKYFSEDSSLTLSELLNIGIKKADGKYIKILHSTDWFTDASSLESYVDLMDNNSKAVIGFSNKVLVNVDNGSEIYLDLSSSVANCGGNLSGLIEKGHLCSSSSYIFRNGSDLTFDEKLKYLYDLDLSMFILTEKKKYAFTDKMLVKVLKSDIMSKDFESEKKYIKEKYSYIK